MDRLPMVIISGISGARRTGLAGYMQPKFSRIVCSSWLWSCARPRSVLFQALPLACMGVVFSLARPFVSLVLAGLYVLSPEWRFLGLIITASGQHIYNRAGRLCPF